MSILVRAALIAGAIFLGITQNKRSFMATCMAEMNRHNPIAPPEWTCEPLFSGKRGG